MSENSVLTKLSNLLGSYDRAQRRIDADYADILDPASELPVVDLQGLVALAAMVRSTITAWEYPTENAKPELWIALARKACYAVGYIVRRFQDDAALCAAFVAYGPYLDQIKRYLRAIEAKLTSGNSVEDVGEIEELDKDLEDTFACLKLSRGNIMCAIIARSFSCARTEIAEKTGQPKRPSRYYSRSRHVSSASPSTAPGPSHNDNDDGYEEEEMDPNAEVYHPHSSSSKARRPTSSNITKADKNSAVHKAPGQRKSTNLRVDMMTVKRISEATTPSPYDAEGDRRYDPYTSPVSSTRSPLESAYNEYDKPIVPTHRSTSKSAFASPTSSVMPKMNNSGYMKDSETSVTLARETTMPTCEEPEEMAPEEFGSAQDPQAHPNPPSYYERPHYDHAYASAPGPPVHPYHHRPPYNPAQSYPPYHQYAAHSSWVHPHSPGVMHQNSAPGVYISHSLNQIGNTTTHVIERVSKSSEKKKKKSRASTSRATMSHQYD